MKEAAARGNIKLGRREGKASYGATRKNVIRVTTISVKVGDAPAKRNYQDERRAWNLQH
jgi:hypothetical protein